MKVSEIMSKNPAVCTSDTKLQEAAKMMVDNDCGSIPVVDGKDSKKPVGMITDRDITVRTVAEGKNPLDLTVGDAMTKDIISVNSNSSVEECCDLMEKNQLRRIVAVDEQGAVCGMVAQADIAINADKTRTAEVVKQVSK